VGHTRAVAAWRILLKCRSFLHAAIVLGCRVICFGSGVFVTDAFALEEIIRPRPGLNARIVGSIDAGRPVVLDDAALRKANGCEGLTVVILSPSSTCQEPDVNTLLARSFIQELEGYRLRRILREATSRCAIEQMQAQRVFGTMTMFDDERGFGVSERGDAVSVPGSI
jgi:hypothetical protein